MIGILYKEVLKGKSLGRILVNLRLKTLTLEGEGIDLSAKTGTSSYYRFINTNKNTKIIYTDLYPSKSTKVLKVDLEDSIPVSNNSQDFLLLMNVLEHIFDYKTCITECYRVLKPQGRLIGCVPFLHKIHPDPDDYWRYTKSTLERIFGEAGFKEILVEPLGFGPLTAGVTHWVRILKLKRLIFLCYLLAINFDRILNAIFKGHPAVSANNFPLVYFFIAKK